MDGPTQYSTCWAWMGKMHFHQECNWFDRSLFQHVTGFIAAFFQKCTWLNHIQRGIGGAKGGNGRWAPLHLGQKKKKAWKSIVNEYNLRGIKYWLSSSNYHAFFTSSLHHSPSSAKPETSYKESEQNKKVTKIWYNAGMPMLVMHWVILGQDWHKKAGGVYHLHHRVCKTNMKESVLRQVIDKLVRSLEHLHLHWYFRMWPSKKILVTSKFMYPILLVSNPTHKTKIETLYLFACFQPHP